jgi:hypothetical protein
MVEALGIQHRWVLTRGPLGRALVIAEDLVIDDAKEESWMAGPLNSLVWYVPSLRYTRGLGWRIHCGVEVTESRINKQHIICARK